MIFCPNCGTMMAAVKNSKGELDRYCKRCSGEIPIKKIKIGNLEAHIERAFKEDQYVTYSCEGCYDNRIGQLTPKKFYILKDQFGREFPPVLLKVDQRKLTCPGRKNYAFCKFYEQ